MKRLLFAVVTALLVALSIEALALVGLRVVDGSWVGYAGLAAERAVRTAGVIGGSSPSEAGQRAELTVHRALHPYLGWVEDADQPSPVLFSAINAEAREYGFPNNRHPLFDAPDPRRLVVAVFGGSVAASFVRNGGKALEALLAHSERFRGREVRVLSLALPGFKQPQQLMALSYFLALGAHFDVVVELDGFNELMTSVENAESGGVFWAYPKRWLERVAELDESLRLDEGELAYVEHLRAERARWFSSAPLRYSLTAGLLWELLDRSLEERIVATQSRMERGRPEQPYLVRGPRQAFASTDAVLEEVAALWRRSSLEMDALARGRGAEYVHFLQPNQYVEGSKTFTEKERRTAFRPGSHQGQIVRSGYPKLQREGRRLVEQGVSFHDLTPLFVAAQGTIYIDSCCHVNRIGNLSLASAIAEAIEAAPAAPPAP